MPPRISMMTHDKVMEIKESFFLVDSGGEGTISMEEFKSIAFRLLINLTEEAFQEMLHSCHFQDLTRLTFPQFFVLVSMAISETQVEEEPKIEDMLKVFKAFDTENTGCVKEVEFMAIMSENGDTLSSEEVKYLRQRITETGFLKDGMVNYVSFMNMISHEYDL